MLSKNHTNPTAIAALLISLAFFSALSASTPLNFGANISRDQAIATIERSAKIDSRITIGSQPFSAELHWMQLDWSKVDWIRGSYKFTYVSAAPVGDYKPFWMIEYKTPLNATSLFWGRYIVDATTGDLMSAMYDYLPIIDTITPSTGAVIYLK